MTETNLGEFNCCMSRPATESRLDWLVSCLSNIANVWEEKSQFLSMFSWEPIQKREGRLTGIDLPEYNLPPHVKI